VFTDAFHITIHGLGGDVGPLAEPKLLNISWVSSAQSCARAVSTGGVQKLLKTAKWCTPEHS